MRSKSLLIFFLLFSIYTNRSALAYEWVYPPDAQYLHYEFYSAKISGPQTLTVLNQTSTIIAVNITPLTPAFGQFSTFGILSCYDTYTQQEIVIFEGDLSNNDLAELSAPFQTYFNNIQVVCGNGRELRYSLVSEKDVSFYIQLYVVPRDITNGGSIIGTISQRGLTYGEIILSIFAFLNFALLFYVFLWYTTAKRSSKKRE